MLTSSAKKFPAQRAKQRMLVLEQRFVFDAALAAELTGHLATVDADAAQPNAYEGLGLSTAAAAQELSTPANDGAPAVERSLSELVLDHNSGGSASSIAFIDDRLADIPELIAGISSDVRIVLIDGASDGVAQMLATLQGESDLSAIHVIAHGSEGHLELGMSDIGEASLSSIYRSAFASLRGNLSEDADILIYGCNFGAGAYGQRAMDMLADLTGADVTASIDLTGGAAGADWDLEASTGAIEEDVIAAAGWDHELVDIEAFDGSNTGIKNTAVTGNLAAQVTAVNPVVPVTFTAGTFATAHGSVTIQTNGDYTYTPNTGYLGNDSFIFEGAATDPIDMVTQYATAVETITINPDPGYVITAAGETNTVDHDRPFDGTLADNVTPSVKGGPITTYTLVTGPASGTVVINADGTYTYTPLAGFSGQVTFTYSANDADPESDAASAVVTLNVEPPPLVASSYDSYAVNDTPVTVTPPVTEADAGATVTYFAGSSPNGTLVSNGDGTFTFTPDPGFTGDTFANYSVTDSNGYASNSIIYFHYSATGIAPLTASPETYSIRQGDTANQGVAYFETNTNGVAPVFTITFDTMPSHGTISNFNPATGYYEYMADPGYLGPDTFAFTVEDQYGQSASSVENINIVPPDMSVVTSVKFAAIGAAVPGNLSGETSESAGNTTEVYSINGITLTNGATIPTAHGTVTVTNAATGAYSWQPNAGFSGVEVINWSVKNFWGAGANDYYETETSTDTIVSPNKIYAGHNGYAIPADTPRTGTVADNRYSCRFLRHTVGDGIIRSDICAVTWHGNR